MKVPQSHSALCSKLSYMFIYMIICHFLFIYMNSFIYHISHHFLLITQTDRYNAISFFISTGTHKVFSCLMPCPALSGDKYKGESEAWALSTGSATFPMSWGQFSGLKGPKGTVTLSAIIFLPSILWRSKESVFGRSEFNGPVSTGYKSSLDRMCVTIPKGVFLKGHSGV